MLKVSFFLVDRANYGRAKPFLAALQRDSQIELNIVCAGTMTLDRYGNCSAQVESDGFNISHKICSEVEGSNYVSMTKAIGLAVIDFAQVVAQSDADFFVVFGDRYEALAAAIAVHYQNRCLVHVQGGEVTGTMDESTRHAITKLANLHLVATARAGKVIRSMGEAKASIAVTGCPVGDAILSRSAEHLNYDLVNRTGVGAEISRHDRVGIIIQHPDTSNIEGSLADLELLLRAIKVQKTTKFIWLWPNIDPGSGSISLRLRQERECGNLEHVRFLKGLNSEDFFDLLYRVDFAIGNSSSFIRDTSFTGTPVMILGERQHGREYGENVRFANGKTVKELSDFIDRPGEKKTSDLYGSGDSAYKMVCALKEFRWSSGKKFDVQVIDS